MIIISFLFQLFGATMLLLFAVRMVRTGIERAFGASFRRLLTANRSPMNLAPVGIGLAIVLQSSAAVTLLVAGFAGSGALGFAPGLAIVLGGDLGSALIIQVLSLKLDWLVPVLLTVGGIFFLKTERRSLRQTGRIILGVAFILLSLQLLRETMEPIRDGSFLPAVSAYLERDFLTAFIAGATLAFVMHSSVAAILMCVTIVAIGAMPVTVGASLVMGANLGSALIPIWLSRGMENEARRIPLANMVIRGSAALAVLFVLNSLPVLPYLNIMGEAQSLVNLHILFNALLLLTIPFCGILEGPITAFLPSSATNEEQRNPLHRSVLTDAALSSPHQALANLKREVLRMAGIVGDMFAPVMELYSTNDPDRTNAIRAQDHIVNAALDEIRRYSAAMPRDQMDKPQRKELRALVDYAIALEAAGDIVVKRLLPLTEEMHKKGHHFSTSGQNELLDIHARVAENLATATNVLVSSDVESARLLLEEKAEMGRLERSSRKKHLKRLSEGDTDSFASSDVHLETAYSLKEFNSWVVTVAHPILVREGQLLESRLIQEMKPEK